MVDVRKPRVVVTIHGIQTRGKWQKKITPHLAKHGLVPYHLDYGWFNAIKFFFSFWRKRQVQAIRNELRELVTQLGARRVSIIAHSFGTHIAMEALVRENGGLRYDRVVLTGCILPRNYNWRHIFDSKWVIAVRNERATSDWVVSLADFASRRLRWLSRLVAGDSGRHEFAQSVPGFLLDDYIVGAHSETHNSMKFERWARFIAYPHLPEDILRKVVTELQAFRQEAASILGHPPERVRANLFAPIDGALRILPGAVDNMTHAPEFDLRIEPGHGASGNAFSTGSACMVVKRGAAWTGQHLPGDELAKIHPDLRWVLSLPVKSEARGMVVGVINVDGLDNVPAILQDSSSTECQAAIVALHGGMLKRFGPSLDAAFRGDPLPETEA